MEGIKQEEATFFETSQYGAINGPGTQTFDSPPMDKRIIKDSQSVVKKEPGIQTSVFPPTDKKIIGDSQFPNNAAQWYTQGYQDGKKSEKHMTDLLQLSAQNVSDSLKLHSFFNAKRSDSVKSEDGSSGGGGNGGDDDVKIVKSFAENAVHPTILTRMETEKTLLALFELIRICKPKIPRRAGGFYSLWNPKTMAKHAGMAIAFSDRLFDLKPMNDNSVEYDEWLLEWLAPIGRNILKKSHMYVQSEYSKRKQRDVEMIHLTSLLLIPKNNVAFTIMIQFWVSRLGSPDRQQGRAQLLKEQKLEYQEALAYFRNG